jgi:hypothetical protein
LVLEVITHTFPYVDYIAGIKLIDKSRHDSENFRLEVWTNFSDEQNEAGKGIRKYLEDKYLKQTYAEKV